MLLYFRSLLFAFYLPVLTLIMGICCAPALLISRKAARKCTKLYVKLVVGGQRFLCGTKQQLKGLENIPEGGVIIAGKHQSMWETLSLINVLDEPIYILKQELLNIPVFGWWCRALGYIGIDRKGGAVALREMTRRAEDAMARGAQLVIFPEGTRIQPGETGRYQPGVAGLYKSLNVPCVPFAHNAGLYWQHPGIIHAPGTIIGEFLPPLPPGMPRKSFMIELENQIESKAKALLPRAEDHAPVTPRTI